MRELVRRTWKKDRGAALAIVATSLFLLMGVAAISADLAWYYLNASRVQRTADAAALAGVVYLPNQVGTATGTAIDIAFRNGYDVALADVSVTPTAIGANQLQVRVSDDVDTFFAKVLGWNTMTITRTAVAEYIPPLKLGSPDKQFGNECDPNVPPCVSAGNFWANIHGKWTDNSMGDAYSSWCTSQSDNPNCPQNSEARSTGYLYGIESPSGFTVEFTDLAFHNIHLGTGCPGNQRIPPVPDGCTSDWTRTGDRGCEDWGPSPALDCGPTMRVSLYSPDPTPLDVSDNPLLCTALVPPEPQVPVGGPATYSWETPDIQGCWSQPAGGIYILQVKVEDPGATTNRAGLNRYSVRSTTGNLFGLGDFNLYNNVGNSVTRFYLAEVPTYYNGKTFVVELWDPGDAPGGGTLSVVDPSGSVFDDGACRIYTRPDTSSTWTQLGGLPTSSDCEKSIASQEHNGEWLKFEMDLPSEYACGPPTSPDCWWKMEYDYPGGVNDTTTWRAYMIGNPIHIID